MADSNNANDDLELDSEGNTTVGQSAAVRKNISLKLKGKGRGRGRRGGRVRKISPRKGTAGQILLDEEEEVDENKPTVLDATVTPPEPACLVSIDDDITKLETPTFTTLERANSEPLHQNKKLKWAHKVNLIGEKVVNPMIHCCEMCSLPILIYGRMIPCKHVFCLDCAKKFDKSCPRCEDKVTRVEQSALGSVFICTFGTPRHSTEGCRRTYLSQRDLQAHINHRHLRENVPNTSSGTSSTTSMSTSSTTPSSFSSHQANGGQPSTHINIRDPRNHLSHPNEGHPPMSQNSQPSHTPPPHMALPLPSQGHLQPQPPPVVHLHQHIPDYRDGVNAPGNVQGLQQEPPRPTNMLPPPPQHMSGPLVSGAPLLPQPPSQANRSAHQFVHPPPSGPNHQQYPSPIPVVSTRSNLITVPIQDDNSSSPHVGGHPGHPPPHMSPYAAHSPSPQSHQQPPPPPPMPNYQQPPPAHHYQNAPPPPYSQPPIGQQGFSQPPPTHLPPPSQPMHSPSPHNPSPMHNPSSMYSNHPPVHHPPPPPNYNPQSLRPHPMPRPLTLPQRFPGPNTYDEGHYGSWGGGSRPPPSHPPMAPRPMGGPPPPHGPNDQGFRPNYYP